MLGMTTTTDSVTTGVREIAEALGGVPPMKMHCPVLAEEALKFAIDDYQNNSKRKD